MAKRIRRGTLNCDGAVSNVSGFDWNDAHEFDRSKGDVEMSGVPVEMSKAGSGSFTLLAGHVDTGYVASMVYTYREVEINEGTGAETVSNKTATFTDVTLNAGGSVPGEGRGEKRFSFDYSTCTVA